MVQVQMRKIGNYLQLFSPTYFDGQAPAMMYFVQLAVLAPVIALGEAGLRLDHKVKLDLHTWSIAV